MGNETEDTISNEDFVLFSDTASAKLAVEIARLLGHALGRATAERFPDGEVNVHLDQQPCR